jgi:DNA-binding NarL/FixJ family response regulator
MGDQGVSVAVRVLVADNSIIHTELLGQAIGKDRRIRVVELSTSASEVRNGAREGNPDVVLISETLDQRPGGGLELVSEIRSNHPEVKVIVLIDSATRENVVEAFRAGARGVFCRNQPIKMLCRCISVVNEGQVWANSAELGFLLEAVSALPSLRPANSEALRLLSDRERAVVACLAEGLSNRDIAARLEISQHTVKNYLFRIFEKLGVSSRLELLFFVLSGAGNTQAGVTRLPASTEPQAFPHSNGGESRGQTKQSAPLNSERRDGESRDSACSVAAGVGNR